MRQSMAFNLEFKITYDELSPSLQDMFKSLQGQITDNRNEITNINMDITDITNEITEINKEITTINNHLTQIDNSITNINKNIQNIENNIDQIEQNITQIEGDITNLGDQIVDPDTISNLDFLNLAPKIGFYQDDTIEVISKYNCNNSPENTFNYSCSYAITSDNLGREIVYFGANDGSYESFHNNQWNLFYAYRNTDTEQFIYNNEPLIPKCFEGEKFNISRVISADNDYLLVTLLPDEGVTAADGALRNRHGYIIETDYSTEVQNWTNKIDLSFMDYCFQFASFSTSSYRHCILTKYFKDKGKIFNVNLCKLSNANDRFGDVEIWDVNSKTKKYSVPIPIFTDCFQLTDDYSFSSTQNITVYTDLSKVYPKESWFKHGCLYLYDQELLIFCISKNFTIYNKNTHNTQRNSGMESIVYKCPKSILDNYTGSITLLNSTTNTNDGVYKYGTTMPHFYDIFNRSSYTWSFGSTSYDTAHNRYYWYGQSSRDNIVVGVFRFLNENQTRDKVSKTIYQGFNPGDSYYLVGSILPVDTSLWGKGWNTGFSAESTFMMSGISKSSSRNDIVVSQFQKYRTAPSDNSELILEPKPGYYTQISAHTNLYRMSYNVTSPTTARMFRLNPTKLDSNEPFQILEYHVVPYSESVSNKTTFVTNIYKNNTPNWNSVIGYSGYNYHNDRVFYNYFEDLVFSVLQATGTIGDPYRLCPAIKVYSLKTNSLVHFFSPKELQSMVPDYQYFIDYNTVTYPNDSVTYNFSGTIWLNNRELLLPIYNNNNSRNISEFRSLYLKFNSSFTSIEDSFTVNSPPNQIGIIIGYNCFQYGQYGLIGQSGSYAKYMSIMSQKPILSGYGNKNSDAYTFLKDYNSRNVYYIYCQSAQGLICYIPSTNIFLGGYYTAITNSIAVNLTANADNYIYLERGDDRDTINAYATTEQLYYEGQRLFSKICVAKITTDEANITAVEYYRINIGYNDYIWNGGG